MGLFRNDVTSSLLIYPCMKDVPSFRVSLNLLPIKSKFNSQFTLHNLWTYPYDVGIFLSFSICMEKIGKNKCSGKMKFRSDKFTQVKVKFRKSFQQLKLLQNLIKSKTPRIREIFEKWENQIISFPHFKYWFRFV